MEHKVIKHEFVDLIPDVIEDGGAGEKDQDKPADLNNARRLRGRQ